MVGAVHTARYRVHGAQLHPSSRSLSLPGIAKACELNLRKTLQFGGRSLFPSSTELRAMVVRMGADGCIQGAGQG